MAWGKHEVRAAILGLLVTTNAGWAAPAIVKDGDTLQLMDKTYKLDGIDAPELDQWCIDNQAEPWECGLRARDRLVALVGKADVHCEDLGADTSYPSRRVGICTVDNVGVSLNRQLVQEGFALNFEPYARSRFLADEAVARAERRGLWQGCFTAPRDFRHWNKKDAALLGASCRTDHDLEMREALFPDDPSMPEGCPIKAKFARRALVTGHVGIYHMQGCRSYATLTKPNRWFCSEQDAKAAGFRRAYNCSLKKSGPK